MHWRPQVTGESILWISSQLFCREKKVIYLSHQQKRLTLINYGNIKPQYMDCVMHQRNGTKVWKSCLQQVVLRVDMMMQYFISIKKEPYKVFYLHMLMTFVRQEQVLFQNMVINHIPNAFILSKEELQTFKYLGLNISQTNHGIFMHQKEYMEKFEVV